MFRRFHRLFSFKLPPSKLNWKIINKKTNGDGLRAGYRGTTPISIKSRIDQITGALWATTEANPYTLAANNFELVLNLLKAEGEEIKQMGYREI